MQAIENQQIGNVIDDLVIREAGDLPCTVIMEQHGTHGRHFEGIALQRAEALAQEKAIVATEVRFAIAAVAFSTEFPVARRRHSDSDCLAAIICRSKLWDSKD